MVTDFSFERLALAKIATLVPAVGGIGLAALIVNVAEVRPACTVTDDGTEANVDGRL